MSMNGLIVALLRASANKETILHSGNEYVIPKGTKHGSRRIAGTRTIHGFGGKRIH